MSYFLESKASLRIFKKYLIEFKNYAEDLLLLPLGISIWAISTSGFLNLLGYMPKIYDERIPWNLLLLLRTSSRVPFGAGNDTKAQPEQICCFQVLSKVNPLHLCSGSHHLSHWVTPTTILTLFCNIFLSVWIIMKACKDALVTFDFGKIKQKYLPWSTSSLS